jgi:hypothetical protein
MDAQRDNDAQGHGLFAAGADKRISIAGGGGVTTATGEQGERQWQDQEATSGE